MKNFTIKKVALGLLLAGYAASGAFALSATTINTIHGRAPVVNAKSATASTTTNSVDVEVYNGTTKLDANASWAVGNRVKLIFKTNDADGDTDKLITAGTVQFTYKKGGSWTTGYLTGTPREGTTGDDGADLTGYQVVEWFIPVKAVNATNIAFIIQPYTKYGAPEMNNWFSIDIGSNAAVGDGGTTTPPTTPPTSPPGGGTGGGTIGGGSGNPVTPGATFGLKIVAVTSAGSVTVGSEYQANNGAVTAGTGTGDITLTDKYEVQVWSGDENVTDQAALTAYNWYVTGGNLAAKGTVADSTDNVYFISKGTSTEYELPATNSAVTFVPATADENQAIQGNTTAGAATALTVVGTQSQPEAGLQGFKLGVHAY